MAGKTHRDDEAWSALIERWEASGLTTTAFASTIPGLSPRTLRSRIAKISGGAGTHRDAIRLREENVQLWAEMASMASRCTCQAANESLVASNCRLAFNTSTVPTPVVIEPPEAAAADCHAAMPITDPPADYRAASGDRARGDLVDPLQGKQAESEGTDLSAIASAESIDGLEAPAPPKKRRGFDFGE